MTTNSSGDRLYFCNCEHEPWQIRKPVACEDRLLQLCDRWLRHLPAAKCITVPSETKTFLSI